VALMLRLKAILAGFGLFFTLLAASWFGGRKSAQTESKLEEAEDAIKGHVLRNEVENRVARESDAAARLRKDWSE
jgi:hypothetical protein